MKFPYYIFFLLLVTCGNSENKFERPVSYAEIVLMPFSEGNHPRPLDTIKPYFMHPEITEKAKSILDEKEDAIYLSHFEECLQFELKNQVLLMRFHHPDKKKAMRIIDTVYYCAQQKYMNIVMNHSSRYQKKNETEKKNLLGKINRLEEKMKVIMNNTQLSAGKRDEIMTPLLAEYDSLREIFSGMIEKNTEYEILKAGKSDFFPFLIYERNRFVEDD